MSTHSINMDAIQAGVEAFLQTYPDVAALDARSPTAAPRGAHAVLWIDDFWRGVDMAREALEDHDLRPERVGTYPGQPKVDVAYLRRVACNTAETAMANGWDLPDLSGEYINREAVEVFVCQIGSLIVNGDADWHSKTDPETVADRAEPG
jgi:hypothetical protein